MGERQIGLRKRVRPFTAVPNDVVDDWTIGYRELGILVRILRMPDGFVIRSDQLSTEGKGRTMRGRKASREGREAVRTALRNLACAGYYRLVRQRMLDGTFAMATDITEDPDPVWAAQAGVFGGRPVPLVEQEDGTFLVKYPDGFMLPDGSMPPAGVAAQPDTDDGTAEQEQPPKPRNPSSGNRAPGNPASGDPASGRLGAIKKMVSKDGQKDDVPASQARRADDGAGGQIDIDGNVGLSEAERERKLAEEQRQESQKIAREWIDFRAKHNCPVVMGGNQDPQAALAKNYALPALKAGYTAAEIKLAMMWCDTGIPAKPMFESGLAQVRAGWRPLHGWKPGDGRDAGGVVRGGTGRRRNGAANENRHIDDIPDEQRDQENPFARASRQSDYLTEEAVA